ncbi:MAG: UDP-N-acetylmuramate--L-alanine ligase [Acidobacteria bacterium]|nr:UDP-N-acetylmuramate--L-alanine ligase [Acidobacteriota bacterium]
MKFGRIKNIHFVGIGGIGMSGIAEILSNYELSLSGCDAKLSPETKRLAARGIPIQKGHDPAHVEGADLLVISSAIPASNEEVATARSRRVPVIRRAEMLGELTRLKRGIAIGGTHGKTTTSAMTAKVLSHGGLDPTLIVGGVLRDFSSNAKLGTGDILVVEADEYDRSLLTLHPEIAVITNIEVDHLDIYEDLDDIRSTFGQFVGRVPFYGLAIGCVDDPRVSALLDSSSKRFVGYGLGESATLRALELEHVGGGCRFTVSLDGKELGRVSLSVPGEHNVRNALAAIAVGLELEVPFEKIAEALAEFQGVERRFQHMGQFRGALVVDDYGHHPTEVEATIMAARNSYRERRLFVIFQPHLYSRTRDFFAEFAQVLSMADLAWVIPVYGAREEPIDGVSSALITEASARRGAEQVQLVDGTHAQILERLSEVAGPNDVIITMGAGDVHEIAEQLVSKGPA